MKMSEAKYQSNRKWNAANLERIAFDVRKGQRDMIKERAARHGESVNAYLLRLVQEDMQREE